ncbi:hypothetical protein PBI_BANDIK_61 [Microbacterium phage Bandik]|uniref:Uncharacterized protein n=1 Tax=Microbacterium phage Bandik TaxID=2126923 RepID=A0A2R3ZZA3_9CAUD|nr:hypothetical protein PBI_BANDIK_61 [Microbacterium phage Bandik]
MNADRRIAIDMIIEIAHVVVAEGSVPPERHSAIGVALKALQQAEYWALRGLKPERNDSSAKQHAIATVALSELESALADHEEMAYEDLIEHLEAARSTDGTAARAQKEKSKQGLRKRSK